MKLLVSNEDHEKVAKAIQVIRDQEDLLRDELREEVKADFLEAFIELKDATLGASAGQLDTALIDEIGKAYRERYDQAGEAGDEVTKNRMYGAMVAIKRIKDMVNDPQY